MFYLHRLQTKSDNAQAETVLDISFYSIATYIFLQDFRIQWFKNGILPSFLTFFSAYKISGFR